VTSQPSWRSGGISHILFPHGRNNKMFLAGYICQWPVTSLLLHQTLFGCYWTYLISWRGGTCLDRAMRYRGYTVCWLHSQLSAQSAALQPIIGIAYHLLFFQLYQSTLKVTNCLTASLSFWTICYSKPLISETECASFLRGKILLQRVT
jgi:hypothetical protein